MKKTLALLLCVLMLLSVVLASCGEETEESKAPTDESKAEDTSKTDVSAEESKSDVSEDPYRDADGKYVSKTIGEFDPAWKEYGEFKVLVYSNEIQNTYFSEEIESLYDTTDDKIIEAVDTRNDEIEDKYGIKVKAVAVSDAYGEMLKTMSAFDDNYDAAMPFMTGAAVLAQNGDLYDLCELDDYIDLDAPWWNQNANASLSIAGRLFFTTGDISIMQNIVSSGIAFNKDLMAESFPDVNMYELVREGKWTIDKFYEMCKEFTRQGDDNDKMDENDIWGSMGASDSLYFASGETICGKDADDIPIITIGSNNQRSIDVAQKVIGYLKEKGTWCVNVEDFTDQTDKWGRTVKIFGEGQALFDSFAFSALKKFRAYPVVYGVVPLPKYNEIQDTYFSRCSANSAYGTCIPKCVKDVEFSAFMVEALAVGGKNYVTPAYKTAVLMGKDANTEEDEEMLGIIFDNILYDPALVYQFGDINKIITNSNTDNLISNLESLIPSVENAIEQIVEKYESID